MLTRLTLAHLALALLAACPSSHTGPPEECGAIVGTCMDECCNGAREPVRWDECTPICPAGTSFIDRCLAVPGCGLDASTCPTPGMIPPTCWSGGCCADSRGPARWDCDTLSWVCDWGSTECSPDPRIRCPAPWLGCSDPTDCVLANDQCCGPCEQTLANTDSVNRDRLTDYFDPMECDDVDCAPCPPPSTDPLRPRVFPTCGPDGRGDLCNAFDLRSADFTVCASDADCAVRSPDCCECGGDTSLLALIALRGDRVAEFTQRVCARDGACPGCLPEYPANARAFCAPDGHCAVAIDP